VTQRDREAAKAEPLAMGETCILCGSCGPSPSAARTDAGPWDALIEGFKKLEAAGVALPKEILQLLPQLHERLR
jgi:hypothetical protein